MKVILYTFVYLVLLGSGGTYSVYYCYCISGHKATMLKQKQGIFFNADCSTCGAAENKEQVTG